MPATPISPAIPDSADGQTRQLFRILLDRVNYLTQEVERLQTRPAGEVSAVRQQVGQLSVAVQAVKDALTQQSTFVSFGSATPIDEFDPNTWPGSTNVSILGNVITGSWNASVIQPQFGGTGLSIQPGTSGIPYVSNGSWELDTPAEATARLDVFTALAKGLVPNPGTVTNKFLRDDGTWQTVDPGVTLGLKGDINVVSQNDWQIVASAVGNTELANNSVSADKIQTDAVTNDKLLNDSVTIAGNSVALGGSVSRDQVTGLSADGIVKRSGANNLTQAVAGTDYSPALVAGTNITLTPTVDNKITVASTAAGVTPGDKGDITVDPTGTTWTIDNDAVTYAKIQNVTDNRLLGRSAGTSGDVQEITVGTGLSLSAGSLTATGGGGGGTDSRPYVWFLS